MNMQEHIELPQNDNNLYILFDGALLSAAVLTYTHDDSPIAQSLYAGTRHSEALEVSPYLVRPSATSRLWDIEDQWRHAGIVLQSSAESAVLADHLRSLISIRMPSQQLAYCRFYSPNWMRRLLSSFSEKELSAFSGPVERWYAYGQQEWISLTSEIPGTPRKAADEGWFHLRQEHLDLLHQDETQRFIERMAQHFDCPPSFTTEGAAAREKLALRVGQAQRCGFTLEHQCIHYLELAWRFPRELDTPELHKLLTDQHTPIEQRLEHAEKRLFDQA